MDVGGCGGDGWVGVRDAGVVGDEEKERHGLVANEDRHDEGGA